MSKMNYEERKQIHAAGIKRVNSVAEPEGQKFPCGSRVKITNSPDHTRDHFPHGVEATVMYTYAHAYGGEDVYSYCLNVDGHGEISWYEEDELELVLPKLEYWNVFTYYKDYPEIVLLSKERNGLACRLKPSGNIQLKTHQGGGHGEPNFDDPGRTAQQWIDLIREAELIRKYYYEKEGKSDGKEKGS